MNKTNKNETLPTHPSPDGDLAQHRAENIELLGLQLDSAHVLEAPERAGPPSQSVSPLDPRLRRQTEDPHESLHPETSSHCATQAKRLHWHIESDTSGFLFGLFLERLGDFTIIFQLLECYV